jgi:hypothetical protein
VAVALVKTNPRRLQARQPQGRQGTSARAAGILGRVCGDKDSKKFSTHDRVRSLRALILFMGAFVALLAGSAVPAVAATVSAQPNVPASALPSDGVQIEYGDGFGAQLNLNQA